MHAMQVPHMLECDAVIHDLAYHSITMHQHSLCTHPVFRSWKVAAKLANALRNQRICRN